MSKCSKWTIFSQLRQILDLVIGDFLYLDFRRPCSTLFFSTKRRVKDELKDDRGGLRAYYKGSRGRGGFF